MYDVLHIEYSEEKDADRFAGAVRELGPDLLCEVKPTENGYGVFFLSEEDEREFVRRNDKRMEARYGPAGR